jgi:GDPmannose 4,6-dehydratase
VKEFVEEAFSYAGLEWQKHVKISDRYFRPLEVDTLIADTTKSRAELGWEARIKFHDLVAIMVDADVEALGLKSPGRGKAILEEKIGSWNRWHNSVTRVTQAVQGQASH